MSEPDLARCRHAATAVSATHLALALLVGCRHPVVRPAATASTPATAGVATTSAAPAPAPTPAPPPARPPPTPALASPAELCARVTAAQRALLDRAGVPADAEMERHFPICLPTPQGAWSVEIDTLRPDDCNHCFTGHWSLAHLDMAGGRVAVSLARPRVDAGDDLTTEAENLDFASDLCLARESTAITDYDGDGEPELALVIQLNQNESADPTRGRVWTFRDGRIALYAPTAAVDFVRADDLDHDGRVDLLVTRPFVAPYSPGTSGFEFQLSGPEWALHSTADGGFSSTDAVAVGVARERCPRPPGLALRTGTQVACARAWGMSTRAVEAAIERGCGNRMWPQSEVDRRCPELAPMQWFARQQAPTPLGR